MRTPVHCRRRAYEQLASQLPVLESGEALLDGALALALHEMGRIDADDVSARLQSLAETICSRITRVDHVEAVLAHAHALLFDELGFTGNRDDYDAPDNSYLPRVLETRRGLPITLTLVYKLVLERVGLTVRGVAMPGHFLAAVADEQRWLIVDPFDGGRLLSLGEAWDLAERVSGEPASDRDSLPLATHRHWLTRMAANLHRSFTRRDQPEDAAAMRELMQLLQLGG